jgi:hypothetical protein
MVALGARQDVVGGIWLPQKSLIGASSRVPGRGGAQIDVMWPTHLIV